MRTLLACAILLGVSPALQAEPTALDVQHVLQRDFKARGQATMDRIPQDGLQRLCTETHDRPPPAIAKQLEADQMKTIAFPEGNLVGDWKRGEKIAQNGRGLMWSDKAGAPAGGSCYNCHQLSPAEDSYGRSTSTARSTTRRRTTPARRCRASALRAP
jgi:sulfur-oxidizing protein SoxX